MNRPVSMMWMVLAVVAVSVTGCQDMQTWTNRRAYSPPRPKPKIMKVRHDVSPNRMTLIVGPKADDVEGDGQADMISVSVVLFEEPRPEPVIVAGAFEFQAVPMYADPDAPLLIWRFDASEAQQAQGPTMFGLPGFRFQLDVRAVHAGPVPSQFYNILGRFQPADGAPQVICKPDQRLVRLGNVS